MDIYQAIDFPRFFCGNFFLYYLNVNLRWKNKLELDHQTKLVISAFQAFKGPIEGVGFFSVLRKVR